MKIISILTLLIFSSAAHAVTTGDLSKLGDILRNADGSIRYMNQFEAAKACPAGSHLPTIRELAEISQSLGARGILEMDQVQQHHIPKGYSPISANDLVDNKWNKDEFYYNWAGYQSPWGATEDFNLWTSSLSEKYLNTPTGGKVIVYYTFNQRFGFLYDISPYYSSGPVVRCFSDL